jgi:hypothetical protein
MRTCTEGVEDCRFLWPPDSEAVSVGGIAPQARAFVELVGGGPALGAGPEDAVAALAVAVHAQSALRAAEAAG